MAICQCWARERDHELQIPHHQEEDRKIQNVYIEERRV